MTDERGVDEIAAVIVARLDSARLPRKALADVGGMPLIGAVVERVRGSGIGPVMVATTARAIDDDLAAWGLAAGVLVYRDGGDVNDVAGRLRRSGEAAGCGWVARINGDSPFVDGGLLREAAGLIGGGAEYVTNLMPRTHPYGVAVEVCSVAALRRFEEAGLTAREREHATLALRERLPRARVRRVGACAGGWADERLTVDTAEDLDRVRAIVKEAGPGWTTLSYAQVLRPFRLGAPA